jgi:hypothetical protein
MNTWIGFDPSKKGGYLAAYNEKQEKWSYLFVNFSPSPVATMDDVHDWFCKVCLQTEKAIFQIESQYIKISGNRNRDAKVARDTLDLSWNSGRVEMIARQLGIDVVKPEPASTWQPRLLPDVGPHTSNAKREKAALRFAHEEEGEILSDHNFADALCLSVYCRRRIQKREEDGD